MGRAALGWEWDGMSTTGMGMARGQTAPRPDGQNWNGTASAMDNTGMGLAVGRTALGRDRQHWDGTGIVVPGFSPSLPAATMG